MTKEERAADMLRSADWARSYSQGDVYVPWDALPEDRRRHWLAKIAADQTAKRGRINLQ